MTGVPASHPTCGGQPTIWEVCTCGSGGHPRRCELHPLAYDLHLAELHADLDMDEAQIGAEAPASSLGGACALCHEPVEVVADEEPWSLCHYCAHRAVRVLVAGSRHYEHEIARLGKALADADKGVG